MNFKKIMVGVVASVAAVSAMAVAANAATAGLTYQTNVYGFRDNINQSKGIYWDEFEEAQNNETSNFGDVEITGDGQYTVTLEKSNEEESTSWNMLKLQTNIPSADYADVTITIDKVVIDGQELTVGSYTNNAAENLVVSDYSDGYNGITELVVNAYTISIVNVYGETCVDNVYGDKVEVTFTVSGFGGAAGDGTDADDNTVDAGAGDTTAPTTGDKGAADTGVEGVAVVAAIAIVAAGAVVVAKKRS